MNIAQVAITTATTLIAVILGGWLTMKSQERLSAKDHDRQWRDIRLAQYADFLMAFREYVAYLLLPDAHVKSVPRATAPYDLMPFFDAQGNRYKERLEATKTTVRLVSERQELIEASRKMMRCARRLASDRASLKPESMPPQHFTDLWEAERAFVNRARAELGLPTALEFGT